MSDRTSTEDGQPNSLLSYIGAQEFIAEEEVDGAVNTATDDSPSEPDQATGVENVNQGSSSATSQVGVTPTQVVPDDEKIQLQQQLEAANTRYTQSMQALTLVAQEAKRREEALFNEKIELLTPEEAESERERRRVGLIEADNNYLRSQFNNQYQRQAEVQENIDKTQVAHKLVSRLELPATDAVIMQTLMESEDFPEMVAKAQRIANVYKSTAQTQARTAAETANRSGVHAGGGEQGSSAAPKPVPQRQGNLIDMMRERQYEAVDQTTR